MRVLELLCGLLVCVGTLCAKDAVIVDHDRVFHGGVDVVAYFRLASEAEAIYGSRDFPFEHEGVVYYFANAVHQERFAKNPTKFLPQYGGYCALAVAQEQRKVASDPNVWTLHEGKLYLYRDVESKQDWLSHRVESVRKANVAWNKIAQDPYRRSWLWSLLSKV